MGMPRPNFKDLEISTNLKKKEEMVNSVNSNGLSTSSWTKFLPSVTPSETELMTTSTMKDSTACSTERLINMSKLELMQHLTDKTDQVIKIYFTYSSNRYNYK